MKSGKMMIMQTKDNICFKITLLCILSSLFFSGVTLARNTCTPDTITPEDDVTISASNYNKGTWGNISEDSNSHLTAPGPMDKNADSNHPLPIEFLYIRAKADEKKVVIAWANASELNNNYFTVERSTDRKNFTAIGKIEGAGDSQEIFTYNFTDSKPVAGINYYRVKQTNFDGAFDYSETVVAQVSVPYGEPLIFNSNPATGIFKIDVTAYHEQQVFLEIVDFAGKTIETKNYDLSVNLDPWVQIDLSEHPKGLYYVTLKTATQVHKGKVIIL